VVVGEAEEDAVGEFGDLDDEQREVVAVVVDGAIEGKRDWTRRGTSASGGMTSATATPSATAWTMSTPWPSQSMETEQPRTLPWASRCWSVAKRPATG